MGTVTAPGFANVTRRCGLNRSHLKGDECRQVWIEWVSLADSSDALAFAPVRTLQRLTRSEQTTHDERPRETFARPFRI